MDLKAIIIDEEQKAQDEVLKALLSNKLFNEFDPAFWASASGHVFAEKAFPVLAKYHPGKELGELSKGHDWLTNLAIPSKRHESAHVLRMDPARNLTILDVVTKLHFLKIWGSAMLQNHPACCVYNEMVTELAERRTIVAKNQQQNISLPGTISETEQKAEKGAGIDDLDLKLKEHIILQDFRIEWPEFVKRSKISVNEPYRPFWLIQETSMLLADAYGRYFWPPLEVIQSWTHIKYLHDQRRHTPITSYIKRELNDAWREVRSDSVNQNSGHGRLWVALSDNIWSFCLAAGCPKADRHSQFKSLEMLRDLVSRQFMYTADLHNRILDLNKQIILQQRIIMALAHRNVLERLSAGTPCHNATEKWHNFVDKMFRNVEAENGKIPPDNPFNDLLDQHKIDKKYLPHHLQEMAKELYSTLSRTIHNFQPSKDFDQYTPRPGHVDPMQIDFMTAMKPLRKNLNDDENPIWEKERARYPRQVVDVGQTVEPEKQTTIVNKVKSLSPLQTVSFSHPDRTWEISIRGRQLNVHRQGRVLYPEKVLRRNKDPLDFGPNHRLHVENLIVLQWRMLRADNSMWGRIEYMAQQ